MKRIENITKNIPPIGTVDVKTMLKASIENYEDSLKGIANIRRAIKLCEIIDKAGDIIEVEDADFEHIYKAVDANKWTPNALKFAEFFNEMERLRID